MTVVPANATAEDILRHKPDGVFLSNGPGDPAATGDYAVPVIKDLIETRHADLRHLPRPPDAGARARRQDREDAPRPSRRQPSGQGPARPARSRSPARTTASCVVRESLPEGVTVTHVSLFDGRVEGLQLEGKPVFSVQYHPEASPGPQDSHYLFDRFVEMMEARK